MITEKNDFSINRKITAKTISDIDKEGSPMTPEHTAHNTIPNTKKRIIYYIILYILFTFEFSTYGTMIDQQSGRAESSGTILYFLIQVTQTIGFLLFPISRRIFKTITLRKTLLNTLSVLFICSMIGMIFLPAGSYILILCDFISSLCIGYIGTAVYYSISSELYQYSHLGLIVGGCTSISILLQFLLQEMLQLRIPIIIMLTVIFILLLYLILRKKDQVIFNDLLPYAEETPNYNTSIRRKVIYAVILGLSFYVMALLNETTYFYAETNFMSFPRLFVIVGYLFVGLAFDIFGSRFIHIFGLCAMVVCFACTYSPDYPNVRFSLFYFIVGAMTGYLILSFLSLAPKTKNPDLWVSFARIINILETFAGLYLTQRIGQHTYLIILILALLFIGAIEFAIADLLTQYQLDAAEQEHNTPTLSYLRKLALFENASSDHVTADHAASDHIPSDKDSTFEQSIPSNAPAADTITDPSSDIITDKTADKFLAFTKAYHFTPRECDVLKELLTSDDTMKNIAEALGISERMLYRYMNNLYQKTGAETRAALMKLYYESTM